MLTIRSGEWEAELLPALGGSVGALRYHGRDVLRPTPEGANDPLQAACFPLLPYANRIAHGSFEWRGVSHLLPRNFGDHPHVLHGTGWQSRWAVIEQAGDSVLLEHRHSGVSWPWSFVARQHFLIDQDGFSIRLELTNLADQAMPIGLGFHPYFLRDEGTLLKASLGAPWRSDADCLPTVRGAVGELGDWSVPAPPVADRLIDHCFAANSTTTRIIQHDMTIIMTASPNLGWLHLYMPEDAGFFCAEPVSHMPDALNRDDAPEGAMASLALGARLTANMRIEAALTGDGAHQ